MQDRYDDAINHYQTALPTYHQIGDRSGEASTLLSMGRLSRAARTGDHTEYFAQAASIFRSIGLENWAAVAEREAVQGDGIASS